VVVPTWLTALAIAQAADRPNVIVLLTDIE
jgi:hypothetical protein